MDETTASATSSTDDYGSGSDGPGGTNDSKGEAKAGTEIGPPPPLIDVVVVDIDTPSQMAKREPLTFLPRRRGRGGNPSPPLAPVRMGASFNDLAVRSGATPSRLGKALSRATALRRGYLVVADDGSSFRRGEGRARRRRRGGNLRRRRGGRRFRAVASLLAGSTPPGRGESVSARFAARAQGGGAPTAVDRRR